MNLPAGYLSALCNCHLTHRHSLKSACALTKKLPFLFCRCQTANEICQHVVDYLRNSCLQLMCPSQNLEPRLRQRLRNFIRTDDAAMNLGDREDMMRTLRATRTQHILFQDDFALRSELNGRESRGEKRRWGQTLVSCVALKCEGLTGADRMSCAMDKCHTK